MIIFLNSKGENKYVCQISAQTDEYYGIGVIVPLNYKNQPKNYHLLGAFENKMVFLRKRLFQFF